ncbi:two pore domain potassium channel family protein [Candidatus Woesearchaeota archaeon]|nr:two pore domain potassium channel family protein [Candidatus Woesearchaeota archaeon]
MKKEEILRMEEDEHRKFHRRIIYITIVILLFLFGGATYYHYIEGWRYLDALYFTSYTLTTVGYGDIVPKTDAGKIFTIFYVFAGVGMVLYGLSIIASHFVEVREEFWLEKISNIKIKHPKTFFEKLMSFFNFESDKLVKGYEIPGKRK